MTPCAVLFILEGKKMNENFDAFDDYALKYDMNKNMISYKYNHSYRVVHQAEEICRSLEFDTEERDLASLIALLHDIARFKQWTEYETFEDSQSFDHGEEGVKILFEEGEIKNYICKEEDYSVIKAAIRNHNKFKINTKGLNDREILHSKIVRDADKLDILYAFSTNRLLELENDNSEISEEVKDAFMHHTEVLKKDIKNVNDRLLMMIGLVFDLNYDYSKERVLNEKYIEKIYDHIKLKKIFKPFIDETIKYLKGGK